MCVCVFVCCVENKENKNNKSSADAAVVDEFNFCGAAEQVDRFV